MDGTTTMQGTEQEVQNTATETQGQQTAESTPEKVSTLQKFIDGLFGGGKKAEGTEPEKKDGDPAAEKAEEEKSFTQADVDAAIEAAKQQWLDEAAEAERVKKLTPEEKAKEEKEKKDSDFIGPGRVFSGGLSAPIPLGIGASALKIHRSQPLLRDSGTCRWQAPARKYDDSEVFDGRVQAKT